MKATSYRQNTINTSENSVNDFSRQNQSKSQSISTRLTNHDLYFYSDIQPSISTTYHRINFSNKINNQRIYTNQLLDDFKPKANLLEYLGEIYSRLIIDNSSLRFILNEITKKYIIDDQWEVFDFLYRHQELFLIVVEAEKQIKKYFNNDKISLNIITDPEIANWENLSITIHTKLNVDQAFDKLKQLDHDWWLDIFAQVGNKLNIHIDFDEI
ncbi:MAG: hypothetical protein IGQ45_07705 [Cyanobacterium sp. T60_A2020_053]|nr:hypothetical protein [Cyanobacterium sp. T60_A2020_053]